MAALAPDEVIRLLEQRSATLDEEIRRLRESHERESAEVPRLFLVETEYDLAILRAEAAWVHALLGELVEGTFPGLHDWRAFHGTGDIPDALRELAESKITKA
jgi:hypothetical protein